ncbi:DUF2489 domain-containing protein [Vibrio albus]|jgi:hypothetical protein|uniref:DUF2489 domain-containing protein n=1 Tax=Vibrio albus TaxID=2200953 RepID=A0A2U3B8C2_9VIBR|nr:DUF2489 domain-containing protein [Vibrio albus]PWI33050.1 DUF2489 domain-containing protein [Vibrio albus]
MNVTVLISVGAVVILALAVYAGYLWWQVKKQNALKLEFQTIAIAKRNANIFSNVDTLCLVGIQKQCDLAEISIRLCGMLEFVQGEHRIDVEKQYPAIYELYSTVRDMARGDARTALEKQERMKQDFARHKAESRLTAAITEELEQLKQHIQPLIQGPEDNISVVQRTKSSCA